MSSKRLKIRPFGVSKNIFYVLIYEKIFLCLLHTNDLWLESLEGEESGIYISLLEWLLPIPELPLKVHSFETGFPGPVFSFKEFLKPRNLFVSSISNFMNSKTQNLDLQTFVHAKTGPWKPSKVTRNPNRFVWNFSTLFDLSAPLKKSIHACLVTLDVRQIVSSRNRVRKRQPRSQTKGPKNL